MQVPYGSSSVIANHLVGLEILGMIDRAQKYIEYTIHRVRAEGLRELLTMHVGSIFLAIRLHVADELLMNPRHSDCLYFTTYARARICSVQITRTSTTSPGWTTLGLLAPDVQACSNVSPCNCSVVKDHSKKVKLYVTCKFETCFTRDMKFELQI